MFRIYFCVTVLAAMLCMVPTLAAGDNGPGVEVNGGYLAPAEVDDDSDDDNGSFAVIDLGGTLRYFYNQAVFSVGYHQKSYSWDDEDQLPFGNGRDDPWSDLKNISLGARYWDRFSEKWGWFAGAGLGSSFEEELGPLEARGSGGVSYIFSPKVSASLGAAVSYHPLRTSVFPIVGIRYNRDGGGAGGEGASGFFASFGFPETGAGYRFNSSVAVRASVRYDHGIYRLADDSAVAPEGYVETSDALGGLYLDFSPRPNIEVSLGAVYAVYRSLTLYDEDEDELDDYDVDPAPGLALRLRARF